MPQLHLTKASLEALTPPATGQEFYRDTGKGSVSGLAVRITAGGTKSFVLEMLVARRVRRMTLGRCSDLTVAEARAIAQARRADIAKGIDPMEEKKRSAAGAVALGGVYQAYLGNRALSARTRGDYDRAITIAFADWKDKPLVRIERSMIAARFIKLRDEHGPAWANLCMRMLRAVFNFAIAQYADGSGSSPFPSNPVKILSETRSWARVDRRHTLIQRHQLTDWYAAVISLPNSIVRDYLLLLLFTGLRRREASKLRWSDIDFAGRTLTVSITKNGRPHTLPLSGYLFDLLVERRQQTAGEFVFPGLGKSGILESPKRSQRQVVEKSGVAFSLHDLRRTFITVAESLDIPTYALKRLLNHADGSDVTGGYIVMDIERLRAPMQKIGDYLVRAMGIVESNVVSMEKAIGAP